MALKFVNWIIQYDRPSSPFSETPIRTRILTTFEEFEQEKRHINNNPELRIVKAFKQTSIIEREMIIDNG